METKKEAVEMHNAMIEMHQAGFVACWKLSHKLRSKKDYIDLNNAWRKCFSEKFNKSITEVLDDKQGKDKKLSKKI